MTWVSIQGTMVNLDHVIDIKPSREPGGRGEGRPVERKDDAVNTVTMTMTHGGVLAFRLTTEQKTKLEEIMNLIRL